MGTITFDRGALNSAETRLFLSFCNPSIFYQKFFQILNQGTRTFLLLVMNIFGESEMEYCFTCDFAFE